MLRRLLIIIMLHVGILSLHLPSFSFASEGSFRFHLLHEVHSLDPSQIRGASGSYLFNNLYRSLYRYHSEEGLVPEGARHCEWQSPLRLSCTLQDRQWSNGEAITSKHYLQAFRRLVSPKTKTLQTQLLLNLKNARKILAGKESVDALGIKAPQPNQLIFEFEQPDPEFKHKLISPSLAPLYADKIPDLAQASQLITNGPYKIKKWNPGKSVELIPNPYYELASSRPPVTIYFIEDDITAFNLYQTGELDFLRRILVTQIPQFKDDPGFFQVPVARFDYIGFGPPVRGNKNLRRALIYSVDYQAWKKILHALGRPGCPSMPHAYYGQPICHDYDLAKAKKELAKVPQKLKSKPIPLYFSQMGGDDIQLQMEWLQNQWKIHLGLEITLHAMEQASYLQRLQTAPPALFRKGIGLDRPTCLAGLEIFNPGQTENYIRLNDKKFSSFTKQLGFEQNERKKKQICRKAISHLLSTYLFIPLGEMHFSMLHNRRFKGFTVNEMNQLDLTHLERKKSP